jgi:hypothetical protein
MCLESLPRIQQDSDRPFIRELDFHHFLKASSFAAQAGGANLLHKEFVELSSLFRWCGTIERGPLAAAHIAVERKLRDRQNATANLSHAAVHLSLIVFKHAQGDDFLGQVNCVGYGVCAPNGQQDQQPRADLARDLTVHRDLGMAYSLHDGTHVV